MLVADCPFCSIITGDGPAELVARTDQWVAFFPPEPATIGHTLVVPASHVQDIWGLSTSAAGELAVGILRIAHALRGALSPEGLSIVQSNGRVASQTIDHLHVHLVPRTTGDAIGDLWPATPPALSLEDKIRALSSIRSAVEAGTR